MADQSPSGNLAAKRQSAMAGFFKRAIKRPGTLPTDFLPYRTPARERDTPRGPARDA